MSHVCPLRRTAQVGYTVTASVGSAISVTLLRLGSRGPVQPVCFLLRHGVEPQEARLGRPQSPSSHVCAGRMGYLVCGCPWGQRYKLAGGRPTACPGEIRSLPGQLRAPRHQGLFLWFSEPL